MTINLLLLLHAALWLFAAGCFVFVIAAVLQFILNFFEDFHDN